MYIIFFLNLLLLQHVNGEEVVDVDQQGEVTTEFPTEPPVEMMKVRKRKYRMQMFQKFFLSATNVTQNKMPAVIKNLEWKETVRR